MAKAIINIQTVENVMKKENGNLLETSLNLKVVRYS